VKSSESETVHPCVCVVSTGVLGIGSDEDPGPEVLTGVTGLDAFIDTDVLGPTAAGRGSQLQAAGRL
jgi:hypothetical protein